MYLVNDTDSWSFRLNPQIGGIRQLGAKKHVRLRTEAEKKLAATLIKKFPGKLRLKRAIDNEETIDAELKEEILNPVEELEKEIEKENISKYENSNDSTLNTNNVPEELVQIELIIEDPAIEVVEEPIEEFVSEIADEEQSTEIAEEIIEESVKEIPEEIVIGGRYITEISNKTTEVEVTDIKFNVDGSTTWSAINLSTGRKVSINSNKKSLKSLDYRDKERNALIEKFSAKMLET